jgi:hypothetical protein
VDPADALGIAKPGRGIATGGALNLYARFLVKIQMDAALTEDFAVFNLFDKLFWNRDLSPIKYDPQRMP